MCIRDRAYCVFASSKQSIYVLHKVTQVSVCSRSFHHEFSVHLLIVNCIKFSSYSVTVFQLQLQLRLLDIVPLQLQLQFTEAYFSVIIGFQLQLLLTAITLLGSEQEYQSAEQSGNELL